MICYHRKGSLVNSDGVFFCLQVHGNLSAGHGLLVELIITFQLVFTIFASCDSKRTDVTGSIALAIGISVAIGHLFAVSFHVPLNNGSTLFSLTLQLA